MPDISNLVDIEMAKYVLNHAKDHYEEGWDFIYECYSIPDIIALAGNCGKDWGTFQEAVSKVADFVGTYNDVRSDIQGA